MLARFIYCRISVLCLLLALFVLPAGNGQEESAVTTPAVTPHSRVLEMKSISWEAIRPQISAAAALQKEYQPFSLLPVSERGIAQIRECAVLDLSAVDAWLAEVALSGKCPLPERIEAVRALGKRGNELQIPVFSQLLRDTAQPAALRAEAATTLGLMLTSSAAPSLFDGLLDKDAKIRDASLGALLMLRSEMVVKAAVELGGRKPTPAFVRELSVVLRSLDDKRCETAFLVLQKANPDSALAKEVWPSSEAKPVRVLWRDTLEPLTKHWADPKERAKMSRAEMRVFAVALLDEARFWLARKRLVSARQTLLQMWHVMRQWAKMGVDDRADFFFVLASFVYESGNREAAHEFYARIYRAMPDTPLGQEAGLRAGSCLVRLSRIDPAIVWFEALHAKYPMTPAGQQARLKQLFVLYRNRRYKETVVLAEATEMLYRKTAVPIAFQAAMIRVQSVEAMNDLPRAIRLYLALAGMPEYSEWSSEALFRAADCAERNGDLKQAKEILLRKEIQSGQDIWAKLGRDRLLQLQASPPTAP